MSDYDVNADGWPTASHKWDEQFFRKGERMGRPTEEALNARIAQLKAACARVTPKSSTQLQAAAQTWKREIVWRKQQLAQVA